MPPNKNNKQKYSFQLQRDQGGDLTTNCNTWKHKIARIVDDLGEWREVKSKSRSNEKQSIMSCKALVCSETRNIRYVQKRCSSVQFSSVQFSRSVMSDSLQPHGLQHALTRYLKKKKWLWPEILNKGSLYSYILPLHPAESGHYFYQVSGETES